MHPSDEVRVSIFPPCMMKPLRPNGQFPAEGVSRIAPGNCVPLPVTTVCWGPIVYSPVGIGPRLPTDSSAPLFTAPSAPAYPEPAWKNRGCFLVGTCSQNFVDIPKVIQVDHYLTTDSLPHTQTDSTPHPTQSDQPAYTARYSGCKCGRSCNSD